MNTKSLSSLLAIAELKTIKVKLPGVNTLYTYKTIDNSIQQDDFVIVSFNNAIVKIARVIEIDKIPDLSKDIDYKWIVQKVDFTTYNELNKLEKSIFEKILELENQALIDNATKLLADRLAIDVTTLKTTISKD